jgi:K+-sensing histidine kinase KdpD
VGDAGGAIAGALGALALAAVLVPARNSVGEANIAVALVLVTVIAAALGGRASGACTGVSAALSYNFFHTRPYLSLRVSDRQDLITVALLVVVGLVVGELSAMRRRSRVEVVTQASGAHHLETVAALVAAEASLDVVWPAVRDALASTLGLAACRLEPGHPDGARPLIERSGAIDTRVYHHAPGGMELPVEGADLPVVHQGRTLGYLVLSPRAGRGTSRDERRVAVALSDLLAVTVGERRLEQARE